MTQQHGLTWGSLDFVSTTPAASGYLVESVADGSSFGNPEQRVEVVRSLLTDGALAVLEGWDNREVVIRLRLSAPLAAAGPALAAAEAALMREILATRKSQLAWVPPATDAKTCVFDVVGASLDRDYQGEWDLEEKAREYRYFLLTLTCLPFARTAARTVVPALPPPAVTPVVVVIDTCDSTSGWTASGTNVTTPVVTSTGGYVQAAATSTSTPGVESLNLARAGSISFGSTPYLRITASDTSLGEGGSLSAVGGGGVMSPKLVAASPTIAGASDYYFGPLTSVTSIAFSRASTTTASGASVALRVHEVARTDALPASGTSRQQARSATVTGSAPTQAMARLYDATPAALGTEVLFYTSTNPQSSPALRPFRTASAAETTDSTMVSGKRNTLTSAMTFRIPSSRITEGTYSLLARLNVSTAGTIGWSTRIVSATGTTTVGSSVVISGSTAVGTTGGAYQVVNLASIPLPAVKAEADQAIELTLTGTANMTLDESWLFAVHDGALTWVTDSDSLTWIEIRSPELGAARPSVYGGTGAKGANSVCIDWKCKSFGAHRFEPGLMQIFTVASTSLVSQSELEFYPRYHSHVGDEAA
ncbi:hypothetical protein ACFJIY_07690 [Pimelobacter simplex]|uniref:hypothetical protein n=1 Tax=Nocardioides simplex TaxID=2045 RepID=UPI003672350A